MPKIFYILLLAFNLFIGYVVVSDKFDFKLPKITFTENQDNSMNEPPKKLKPADPVDEEPVVSQPTNDFQLPTWLSKLKPAQSSTPIINLAKISNFAILTSKVEPEKIKTSSYQMIIINEADSNSKLFDKNDVAVMKDSGKIILAEVSVGVAETTRWYWKKEWNTKKPAFLGDQLDTNQYYVKQWWNPEWEKIVLSIVDRAIESGYDGVVLDGIDTYVELGASRVMREKMTEFVIKLSNHIKKQNKNMLVVVKNGEGLGRNESYVNAVDGIVKEDLVYAGISNGTSGPKNSMLQLSKSLNDLNNFKIKGKPVFVIEYISGSDWKSAKTLLKNNGVIGYSAPSRNPSVIRESTW